MTTPLIIPTSNYPDQTFSINLDGNVYSMRVYFNAYDDQIKQVVDDGNDGKWYLDIVGNNTEVIIYGIALVGGCDLLEPYAYDQLGAIFVLDRSGNAEDPTLDGMGDRFEVLYVPVELKAEFLKEVGYA